MQFNNEKTRNVADVAAKIMAGETVSEELKGQQYKIDVNKNNKIDPEDFKHLRAGKKPADVKKEEVENIGEASTYKLGRAAAETKDFPIYHNGEHVGRLEFHTSAGKLHHRVSSVAGVPYEKFIGHPDREKMTNAHVAKHEVEARKHFAKKIKEEVEQIQEYESKDGRYVHKGTYGTEKSVEAGYTDYSKENELAKKNLKPTKPARKKYGARQNYVRSTRVNEGFTDMLELYKEQGIKGLMEAWAKKKVMKEEPTNEKFTKEVEEQQKKSVTKVEEETFDKVEVIDLTDANNIKKSTINLTQESVEQIDELSKDTYKSYLSKSEGEVKKALGRKQSGGNEVGPNTSIPSSSRYAEPNTNRRGTNTNKARIHAIKKLREEDVELDEREMTDAEMKKREDIVKGMKKNMAGFKERYGERAKSVMYATAAKQAMKD